MGNDLTALMSAASRYPGHYVPIADYATRSTAASTVLYLKGKYPSDRWAFLVKAQDGRYMVYARRAPKQAKKA